MSQENQDKVDMTIKTYNEIAETYSRMYSDINRNSKNRDYFLSLLKPKNHILDLGCGHGKDIGIFLEQNYIVTGIDLSDSFIEIASKKFPEANILKQDLRYPEFSKNYFDAVWASASLLHVPRTELDQTLKNIYQIIKPKGIFYSSFQLGKDETIKSKLYGTKSKKRYFAQYSKEEYDEKIIKSGFEIIKGTENFYESKWYSVFAKKI